MTDREKVIKGLEQFKADLKPFCGNRADWERFDAGFALLKEQEEKTGHWVGVDDGDIVAIDNDGFPERACFCSECEKYLIASDEYAVYGKYCPFCGVKMEGR